jgi:guanyl-specific ribonuclease Sa
MRQLKSLILLAGIVLAAAMWNHHSSAPQPSSSSSSESDNAHGSSVPGFLPTEARGTLDRIARGGPFEHSQDGGVFGNYEGLLPKQPRGYYHEYTVETPGAGTRGAKRIITGGTPPIVYYYTDDHYRSFRRFRVDR